MMDFILCVNSEDLLYHELKNVKEHYWIFDLQYGIIQHTELQKKQKHHYFHKREFDGFWVIYFCNIKFKSLNHNFF